MVVASGTAVPIPSPRRWPSARGFPASVNLIEGIDVHAIEEKIAQYQKENAEQIMNAQAHKGTSESKLARTAVAELEDKFSGVKIIKLSDNSVISLSGVKIFFFLLG
ncbi:Transcription elongation factor GreA like [Actinidia chinensis var. chinensis]|uniref:Transcription elongation factor GreA like n=1 Tax=Actinidia chinensis var. chinensis TaxID=1590841 RepID=A0A2R6R4W8_ACTCC|nr:Transcription elongation factor GreA like [Actinidia chinensis var. chinensis]